MRKSFNLTQEELDQMAAKATKLNDWLEEKALSVACRVPIPPTLMVVTGFVVVSGLNVLMDGAMPDSACWGGYGGCIGDD